MKGNLKMVFVSSYSWQKKTDAILFEITWIKSSYKN